ncbi:xaa-Pro aminopeptidase 2-like [Ruditapes philippinarum]|uniref:xaa-Pro aminopeptidase 2-like n=1 Tax=Ruditapes philippinarum TaxID=129788 RepID=UPI00295AD930|nr:xaa-Pro aminopeptidase 2-like [Ruditapes philippinarum]
MAKLIMGNNWNFLFLCWSIVTAIVNVQGGLSRLKRETADLTPGNWDSCKPGAEAPPTRVNTADRVTQLRNYFATQGIQGYLIPNEDAHQSEYPSQYDKRRGYISGFQGSAGFAVITIDKQALWTDGRYFLEAEDTLDCNWILMRQNEPGVPTMIEWLKQELSRGNFFGASPFLIGSSDWKYYKEELLKSGIYMDPVPDELVDRFWSSGLGRPMQPNSPINMLPMQFAGRSWQDKVKDMREAMDEKEVDMMVVTSLDETAWLFNLRAGDIDYNPFFISYAILEKDKITLFLLEHLNKITAEPTDEAATSTVAVHLNTNNDGTCGGKTADCVEVKAYNPADVVNVVKTRAQTYNKVWLGYSCNQAVYSAINESKIHQDNTPIATTKTRKNEVEVEGMKKSHIRDAVALITFLEKLETDVKAGKKCTELSAADDLKQLRLYVKLSYFVIYGGKPEPGYYEDGQFGIRLENIVMVKNASTTYKFPGTQFLTFEHVTLVPYEPHLIKFDLLNEDQIEYLNDYNMRVRDQVGPELKKQGKNAAYDWMMKKTEKISVNNKDTSGANTINITLPLIIIAFFLEYFFSNV